jgi:MFS family permease
MTTRIAMQSAEPASALSEFDLRYYGWRVVLAACFGVMAGFGSLFVYTFTVFVKPLSVQFGWSREGVSLGFGIAAMTVGLSSPLLGRLIDRFGPRRVILPCMTVFGCGIASLALLRSGLWQFYMTCFVVGVVGNGAAHLAYARSISTWFQKRLGTALAFVMMGAGLGAMILPVVAQAVVSRFGWRAAYGSLGCLALLLGLPLSWHYIVERGPMRDQSAFGGVPEFVQHCGKLYPQLAHAKSGDVLPLAFILRTGEDDLIPDVALHLPDITRMGLGDVYGQKGDTILVLLVELVEGGNLPPKGRSSVTAKDEHDRLLGG